MPREQNDDCMCKRMRSTHIAERKVGFRDYGSAVKMVGGTVKPISGYLRKCF